MYFGKKIGIIAVVISLITGMFYFKPMGTAYAAAPTATIVVADTLLAIGETSVVTFTFSEAVSGFSLADLTLSNGILSNLMTSDSITYTATLTPASGTTAASNVITLDNTGVISIGGAAGTGTTTSNNYAVDTVRPTATIAVYDTALTAGETSQVTVTFSEAVTGLTVGDLTVSNGTLTGLSSSDGGIMWTATFTPTANIREANNIITLNNTGISDISGNAGIGTTISNNYAIDTVPSTVPTATIVVADTLLAIGETSVVTFTFSEAVSGFSLADLTLSNGILSNLMTSDSITYTATLTPASGTTAASNVITLDNTGVISIGGAAGTGTTTSNNYTVDTVRPTATIAVYDTALTAGETSQVTVTFSEAVTGLTVGDLTVSNGTLTGLSSSDGGIMWTATFTPTANIREANNIITLDNTGISDISGNAGIGTTDSNPYSVFTVQSVPATTPSSSPPYGPMVPVDNTVTSTTGKITVPTGKSGMVSLGREIQIWIPAGASSQELTLSIDKVLNIETLLKNNEILVSPVFELHKNFPENFLKPIKITFYFQSAGLESHHKAAISYYDEINKTWLKVDGGLINGDQITVEINHFTKFAVLAVGQTNGEFIRNNPVELPSVQSYSDTIGHWAEEGIKQASREGIITGYPDGTFRPGNNVTRAEFSVMLMSALKSKEVGAELLFTDTTEIGAWAKKATSQAVQSGIISGYQDGTFRPNAYLTRAEMVKMVANALYVSTETHDTTPFADAKIIPEWAKTSVALLKERGLVKGMGANQFKPNAQTTRAEAVFLLVNMLEQNNRINN
ncbi:hypothetical protein PAECIP112173_02744 [Paenibacillus sp. JJ-100]|uniref:Ig-like domain-containing protein n=1 Tax=Paenibacillus sp. JJ-100 TaxID=2974896 RepID=UPI0022FFC285|nr:Ig-like domain-containing protein [Paenibacillus sp. JJ-100]CAI6079912.1 hypothetical protein PAECIP112173_02744 [Paenibacillus sp. JJ-100]